jgi:hypothetical protein
MMGTHARTNAIHCATPPQKCHRKSNNFVICIDEKRVQLASHLFLPLSHMHFLVDNEFASVLSIHGICARATD